MQTQNYIHMVHMNSASVYSHFIHGKFVTKIDSGYGLVARSTNLTDEEYLKKIAKTYRFWGSRPPEKNVKAVGIFLEEENQNIVLVKVETAVDESKQEVTSGNRGFNQLHYIFIPIDSVTKKLQGRTFQLLSWINDQPILLFSEFKADLPSPTIPPLNERLTTELNQQEVDKIKRYLGDINTEGQQLLLLALAALNKNKRLLLTGENGVNFVESLLLLLPASVRSKVSIAGGTLDEEYCNWAKVLIKANNPSGGQLVDNLIRLNYGSKKFEGQFDRNTTFKSDYVTLLQSILNVPDRDIIPKLLKQLNSIDDNNLTLKDPAPVNIIVRLIKELPQVFQQVWKSFLSTTKPNEFLKELQNNNNLDLAKTLLQKLLDLLPDEAKDQFIVLCQNIVETELDYIVTLARCLRDSNRLDLLNGKLLDYLWDYWIENKHVDDDLKTLVNQSAFTEAFTTHDWLELQRVCWTPGIELKMPTGRPNLDANEKEYLVSQAIEIAKNFYTQPAQTRLLLEDCKAWQLDLTQLKYILKNVTDKTGDFDLVLEYISTNLEAIDPIEDIPLLFAQLRRLSPADLSRLLDERLKQNLPLAEILLNHRLYEEPCLLNNTELTSKLRMLSRSVVEDKSQKNYLEAWRFATHLATKKIFQDDIGESFMLLDSALAGEIKLEELHNFFNYKFAPLIVYLEPAGIRESQLYNYLRLQHPEVAQLVNTLLTQKNSVLKHLLQLANLTRMKEPEQDKFYKAVLDNWSPSYHNARELLAALINQSHGMDSKNSNGNALVETYEWFKCTKPELRDIFIVLWQLPVTWDIWNKLAKLLYEEQQDSAAFLDKIVGEEFPVEVLETWLPVIAKDDNVRGEFCQNSLAWKQLRSQREYFDRLLDIRPEYATTLTRCLRDSGCLDLLNSKLLYYLWEEWIKHKYVDDDLKTPVTQPAVTKAFTIHDWLKLQRICWIPEIELEMPLGRPDLGVSEKRELVNQAIKIINNHDMKPEQMRRLLQDCKAWQLDQTQLKDILKANPEAWINLLVADL